MSDSFQTAILSVSSPTLDAEPIINFLQIKKIESKVTPSTSIVVRHGTARRESSVDILLIGKDEEELKKIIHLAWEGVQQSNPNVFYGHLQTKHFDGCTVDYFAS